MAAVGLACLAQLARGQALEQAKRAFDAGDYTTAARLFEKANAGSPRCDTLLYLGMARYRLHQRDAALIAFQSAVQCDEKLVPAQLALGEALAERGNDNEAIASFTRALALDPHNTAALRGGASVYLRAQANQQASALLETLVEVEPGDAEAHADLGAAYVATGNRERAERQFESALKLKPNLGSGLLGLGSLYVKNAEESRAIPLLKRAAAAAPQAYEPHYLLGAAYNRLGRYREASVELLSAVRLGGDEAEVYYHLARAYGGLGQVEDRRQALARFAELSRKAKQNVDSQRTALRLMAQAKTLVDAGDLEAAMKRMEEARELRPSDDRLLFRLAGLEFDLQRFNEARGYVQEAISLSPSEWLYYYLLGLVEKSTDHVPEARRALEMAIQLNPAGKEVSQALAELARHEGESAERPPR